MPKRGRCFKKTSRSVLPRGLLSRKSMSGVVAKQKESRYNKNN